MSYFIIQAQLYGVIGLILHQKKHPYFLQHKNTNNMKYIVLGLVLAVAALLFFSSIKLYKRVNGKGKNSQDISGRGKTYTEWELRDQEEEEE